MKSKLSVLFTGQSNYQVLAILSRGVEPLRLRTIAELADMYVRSIELALAQLTQKKIVRKIKRGSQLLYSLNQDHPLAPLLQKVFTLIAESERQMAVEPLDGKAQETIQFSDSALRLIRRAKQ